MNAAGSTYTQTESDAWGRYIECLDELNSQLEHTRLTLEGAFQTAWNNAVRDWTEMETAAWDAYQRARARMLQPPPEGERQVGPPPEGERQPAVGLPPQRALRAASRCTVGRASDTSGYRRRMSSGSFYKVLSQLPA